MYDIIVIGAGSGGLNIAGFMNKTGFSVLLIDREDKTIGGDCLNYGCVPSKALIHTARIVENTRNAGKFGLDSRGKTDLGKVMSYVREKQDIIRKHENAAYFRKIGMDVVLGAASFVDSQSVMVNNKTYSGKKIIIATGSVPRKLKIPGSDKVNYLTNETIFNLKKLPERLLVIGGGPIGIELGQAFQMLGSQVTVVQNGPTFLPKERPEIAEVLLRNLEKQGMKFFFNSRPESFDKMTAIINSDKQGKMSVKFDEVLVSIGRVLNFSSLKPENARIKTDEREKLILDKYLRTTNKRVYAVGDAAGAYQFTHAAELHAGIVLNNFFSPRKKKVSYDKLSWVTYTTPEIATFGLNQAELDKRSIEYEILEQDFDEDDRAITDETTQGKLILYTAKDRILGGTMVAHNAGELFQELVLAQSSGIKLKEIFNKIYPYPTASRINKKIVTNKYAGKLSNFNKKILRWLY